MHPPCGTCEHFQSLPEGQCKINPPTVMILPDSMGRPSFAGVWPPTRANNPGCGQHSKLKPINNLTLLSGGGHERQ